MTSIKIDIIKQWQKVFELPEESGFSLHFYLKFSFLCVIQLSSLSGNDGGMSLVRFSKKITVHCLSPSYKMAVKACDFRATTPAYYCALPTYSKVPNKRGALITVQMGFFSKYEQLNKGVQKGLFLTYVGENYVQEEKISTINKAM